MVLSFTKDKDFPSTCEIIVYFVTKLFFVTPNFGETEKGYEIAFHN